MLIAFLKRLASDLIVPLRASLVAVQNPDTEVVDGELATSWQSIVGSAIKMFCSALDGIPSKIPKVQVMLLAPKNVPLVIVKGNDMLRGGVPVLEDVLEVDDFLRV